MEKSDTKVLSLSYAKRALIPGSRERLRLASYAKLFDEYHLIVFTRDGEKYPDLQIEDNLHIHATNCHTKIGMAIKAVKLGRRIIDTEKWTVTSQDPFESSLIADCITAYKKGVKRHIQIHGDVFNELYFRKNILNTVRTFYAKKSLQRVSSVRVVSERIKISLVSSGIDASKITVLPIQVELDNFLTVGKNRLYLKNEVVKLLYVGRLSPEKNIENLIKSCAILRKKGCNFTLAIYGSGQSEVELKKLTKELDLLQYVYFNDWTESVPSVMERADVFCLNSTHEGYGLVLVEAMAAGMAVVTTDVGLASSVCLQNEAQGLVVPVNDTDAFAEALYKIIKNKSLLEKYGKAGYVSAFKLAQPEEQYLIEIQRDLE